MSRSALTLSLMASAIFIIVCAASDFTAIKAVSASTREAQVKATIINYEACVLLEQTGLVWASGVSWRSKPVSVSAAQVIVPSGEI